MALTESIEYDKIEVVGIYKAVQVRKATVIKKDGVELTRSFERYAMQCGNLDASNNLIYSKVPRSVGVTKSDFLGSSELADKVEQIASEKNYMVIFANKVDGSQSYIKIRRPHTMLGAHVEAMRK